MNTELSFIYDISIWLVGLIFLFILLFFLESGHQIGLKQRKHWEEVETAGGKVVLTAMLALLGLILSFTYLGAVQRFEARKQNVILEANAIGTAFLLADLISEPRSTELKEILLDYARSRFISKEHSRRYTQEERKILLQKLIEQLERLWPITKKIIEEGKPRPIETTLVNSINHVIEMHNIRLAKALDKLPIAVTFMMVFMAAAALGVAGFNAGIYGKMSRWRLTAFALVLTLIMFIIQDYDRPAEGTIRVSNGSLYFLIHAMESDLAQ
jgi:hypothetical protein